MVVAAAGAVVAACTGTRRAPTTTSATSSAPAAPSAQPASTSPRATPPVTAPTGPAVEYASGPPTRAAVALTFHGQGDLGIARDLLAIFEQHSAHVTVLAVGSWLAANPHMADEIIGAGHELGNHTYNHLDINNLDAASARAEIVRCRDLLRSLTCSTGAHFRQSQAQHASALVRQLAGAAGYPVVLSYDVDSLDYTDPGAQQIRRNVGAARAGSIVSMHFGHADTVTAMPMILSDLTARGLSAVTATELLRP